MDLRINNLDKRIILSIFVCDKSIINELVDFEFKKYSGIIKVFGELLFNLSVKYNVYYGDISRRLAINSLQNDCIIDGFLDADDHVLIESINSLRRGDEISNENLSKSIYRLSEYVNLVNVFDYAGEYYFVRISLEDDLKKLKDFAINRSMQLSILDEKK